MNKKTKTQNKDYPMMVSNRKFGWSFSAVFLSVAVYGAWNFSTFWTTLLFVIAFIFAVLTVTAPSLLTVLNKLWYKLGMLIARFLNPIVLGFIFFVIITPVALITRLLGRDVLRIKKRTVSSYWIDRIPAGPDSESFKNQF
jgi:hypothetical protein